MKDLTILQQLLGRWKASSPKVFQVITWISTAIAFITGIPELLSQLGIVLPEPFLSIENKTVAAAALIGAIIAKITVSTPEATDQKIKEQIKTK